MLKKIIISTICLFCPLILQAERTLSIIKPDAVRGNYIGEIISTFENNGLKVVGIKMLHLSKKDSMMFYDVHKDRPFYKDLANFMSESPVVIMVLEGENAIAKNRLLMGATNPQQARPGTIRARFAANVQSNAVHGSDTPETAQKEIAFFFSPREIFSN